MSLLYKPKEEQTTTAAAVVLNGGSIIRIDFYSDCGKFGTEECLDAFTISAERLLAILQKIEDDEIEQ